MGELTFKQAQVECRAPIKMLRAFEKVEAVIAAAASAQVQQVELGKRVETLNARVRESEAALGEARARYTKEQNDASAEMEHLRDKALDQQARLAREADEARSTREGQAQSAITAGELAKSLLTDQCEKLEARKAELEGQLQRVQDEYAAFCEKVGVS